MESVVSTHKTGQIIMHIICIILCVLCVAPFILLLTSSLTEEQSLLRNGYSFFPKEWSLGSYRYLFAKGEMIFRAYGVTIFTTVVGTFLAVMMTLLFAYPLSRRELPFRYTVSFFVFFTMLFNGGLVPTYMLYANTLHIRDTIWALIVPGMLMNGFYCIMMRSFLTSNIPDEILEAARMDGASEYLILFKIVIPLSVPMIVSLVLMIGLGFWNNWTNGLYYLTDTKLYSIQNVLNGMIQNIQFLQSSSSLSGNMEVMDLPSVGIRMAIAVIGIIPILIVYPFLQRYFVKGIVVGGVKG